MLDLFTTVAYAAEAGAGAPAPTQAAQGGGGAATGNMFSIIWIVAMIVVFYFVLIRPQRKQEKALRAMIAALRVGDKVITAGGIAGKIIKIKDDFVYLETGFVGNPNQQSVLKLEKAAIKICETVHDDEEDVEDVEDEQSANEQE